MDIIKVPFNSKTYAFKNKEQLTVLMRRYRYLNIKTHSTLVIQDSFDGTHTGTPASPFSKSGVFSRAYKVHPTSVVGVFIEQPVSSYLAGENIVCMKPVHHTWAILHKIHHLTSILHSLKKLHFRWRLLCLLKRGTEMGVYQLSFTGH